MWVPSLSFGARLVIWAKTPAFVKVEVVGLDALNVLLAHALARDWIPNKRPDALSA